MMVKISEFISIKRDANGLEYTITFGDRHWFTIALESARDLAEWILEDIEKLEQDDG